MKFRGWFHNDEVHLCVELYSVSGLKSKLFVFLVLCIFCKVSLQSHVTKGPDLVRT